MSNPARGNKGTQRPAKSRLAAFEGHKAGNTDHVADWATASPSSLLNLILAASNQGGAIRFGYTRDGGAYALGVYIDGEMTTLYLPPDGDVSTWLEGVRQTYEDIDL